MPTSTDTAGSYRWKVAWTAFVIAAFAWGTGFYGPSVFLETLHASRGWPISLVSSAITCHFLFSAALVVYLPYAHQRLGIRRVTMAGIALLAAGAIAWAESPSPWHLFPAAMLSGAGWAATSGAAINAIVAPWFDRDRPRAISLAFNGASIGGVVFLPLWLLLISGFGFTMAAVIIGASMMLVLLPLAVRYLWPPTAAGGAGRPASGPAAAQSGARPSTRRVLLGDRRFIFMSAAFALGLFAQIGLISQLVVRLSPEFGSSGAGVVLSATTVAAIVGRTVLARLLGDRDRRLAAAVNFSVQAVGVLLLILGSGGMILVIGCILFGLGIGNLTSLPPLIAQKEFAPADVGTVVAMATAINQCVFAFAPAIFGVLRELTADYVWPFSIAICLQLVAAVLVVHPRATRVR